MAKNIGTTDRVIRFVIACLLLIYAIVQGSWIAGGFGLFVLYEALVGWCALYQVLGKNSCDLPPPQDRR